MANNDTGRTIRPRDARILIERCMAVRLPVFIWGPPGIGKSEMIAGIALAQGRPMIDMRLLLLEPTDLKGIPYYCTETKSMRWAKPSDLPGLNEISLHNAILFLDELNAAPPAVQASAYQLLLNRRIGEYVLPEGVSVVCAGNRETDRGVTFRMPTPLANRLVHIEMQTDFEDWQGWALNNNIHADVVGFLSHHKQKLFDFDPKSSSRAFATPRSWVYVGRLLSDELPESINTNLVAGTVGEGLAIEFAQHRKIASKMPLPKDVLLGKEKTLKVKEISAMYSLTISMCYTLKEWLAQIGDEDSGMTNETWHEAVDNFFAFMMENFQTEMIVLGAGTAFRTFDLPIVHRKLKTFKEFHKRYGSYILES